VSTAITYRSYAKLNLYLDVLGKRRDGYHNIETIFQTVSLYDEIGFRDQKSHIAITCSTPELDSGEGNLVHRAAMLLRARTGCKLGARIHLDKHIPIAAGLAGGSGNAAAALIALNTLWDLRLPPARLRHYALELGSDVPYCTLGGLAAATRRGEQLYPLPPLRKQWFVLIHPPIAVSASHTYNHPKLGHNTEKPFAGRTPAFRRAIRHLENGNLPQVIFNRMETPVFDTHPRLIEFKQRLLDMGCIAAAMSGSGPTLYGLCKTQRTANNIAEALTECNTATVSSIPCGVERVQ